MKRLMTNRRTMPRIHNPLVLRARQRSSLRVTSKRCWVSFSMPGAGLRGRRLQRGKNPWGARERLGQCFGAGWAGCSLRSAGLAYWAESARRGAGAGSAAGPAWRGLFACAGHRTASHSIAQHRQEHQRHQRPDRIGFDPAAIFGQRIEVFS